jgi:hypothetical protein
MSSVKQDIQTTQAALDRGDLTNGASAVVPKGDELHPVKIDPFAARKGMFIKADKIRERETAQGQAENDPERIARMEAEARGETYTAPTAPTSPGTPTTPTGQAVASYVNIPVAGGEIRVSQADIDREGGVEGYLRRREQDEGMAQDKITINRLQRELADSVRVREELRQAKPAGQADPATRSAAPADRNLPGSGASEQELTGLATRLAKQIYSGDENDAQAAILEILRRAKGETLSAEDIETRVRAAVAKAAPVATTPTSIPVNPRIQAINAQIDTMALREYPDICKNEVARVATFEYFKQLVALPENRDRRAVDVARDACDWGKQQFFGGPRGNIVEQKRGLPSSVTASGAIQTTTDDEAMSNAQAVAMMQSHRNFGRRLNPQ